jgi:hypothetical protein
MLAGDDAKALEMLSRYKAPTDVTKAMMEQRAKLSQRPEVPKIDDTSTPEQISDFRKAFDVPDVSRDAKDADYAAAYGIKAPEGYEMGQVEQAMLGQFARRMNGRHVPKRAVQEAVGAHFEIQKVLKAQADQMATAKAKEWRHSLQDELGSDEYEGQRDAAEKFLKNEFADNPDELANLLNAQLPGGGRLGDHPWMFKMIAGKAVESGFTDRIQASSLESGGKSLAVQQAELERLRITDRTAYNSEQTQEKLKKIIGLRLSRGEIDDRGVEVRKRG